jgi:hypothetical protein
MFRKPRPSKQRARDSSDPRSLPPSRSVSPSKSSVTSHLVAPSEVPQTRRPRHTQNMFLPRSELLLAVPGDDYTQPASTSNDRLARSGGISLVSTRGSSFSAVDSADPGPELADDIFVVDNTYSDELRRQRQRLKKQKQWLRWTNEVIPSLVQPHLHLLRISESLRSIPQYVNTLFGCNSDVRHLKIVCVYLDSKSVVNFWLLIYSKFAF